MGKDNSGISSIGTVSSFIRIGTCSETLFNILNRAFQNPMKLEEKSAIPLAGGIMQHGVQCGMIWGATLAAGGQSYKLYGAGARAERAAIEAAQRLIDAFLAQNKTVNCKQIIKVDLKSSSSFKIFTHFFLKGYVVSCVAMAEKFAPAAYKAIYFALSEEREETIEEPVSCSALLARRLGMSEIHRVMVSGFAGGVGLCGEGCGALATAIWNLAMKSSQSDNGKVDYQDPKGLELIEKFLKLTNSEIQCSRIVGRKFESVEDHARYLREGGCSKIIDLLTSQFPQG